MGGWEPVILFERTYYIYRGWWSCGPWVVLWNSNAISTKLLVTDLLWFLQVCEYVSEWSTTILSGWFNIKKWLWFHIYIYIVSPKKIKLLKHDTSWVCRSFYSSFFWSLPFHLFKVIYIPIYPRCSMYGRFFYCRHNSPNVGKYSLHLAYMGISKSTMTHQSVRKGACHLGVNAENESSFQVGASQGAHW